MKQLQAHKWSDSFKELMARKSLNLEEYEFCINEWKGAHVSKMIRYYVYAIILFCGGLWAVYEQLWFIAVLLLALAANYNRQSSHHILIDEIIEIQRLLAKFISNNETSHSSNIDRRKEIISEVDAFADSHPYFEELADEISTYISEGMQLEAAYYKALYEKQKKHIEK